jgi:hypothetical protein
MMCPLAVAEGGGVTNSPSEPLSPNFVSVLTGACGAPVVLLLGCFLVLYLFPVFPHPVPPHLDVI